MKILQWNTPAVCLPLTDEQDDERGGGNGDQQADEPEELEKDEDGEDDEQGMKPDFVPDDTRGNGIR